MLDVSPNSPTTSGGRMGSVNMPVNLHRNDVRRMVEEGAQLIEVLSEDDYEQKHIKGAINIPLRRLGKETVAQLQKDRPTITYCYDYQ